MRVLAAMATAAFSLLALAQQPASTPTPAPAPPVPEATVLVTDLVNGIGDEALPGMTIIVHYTGWLFDPAAKDQRGRKFDSSRDRGQPFSFPLGGQRVIRGWEQGMLGMCIGGQRRMVVPPDLAWGAEGLPDLVPPDATVILLVDLLDARPPAP